MEINLVYLGRFETSNSTDSNIKVAHRYSILNDDNTLGEKLSFKDKLINSSIGSIISCLRINDNSFKSFKFVGFYKPNSDDVEYLESCRANDSSLSLRIQASKNMKVVQDSEYDKYMKGLKTIYKSINRSNREAFLFKLLNDIRNS